MTVQLKFEHNFKQDSSICAEKPFKLNILLIVYHFGHLYPSIIGESEKFLSENRFKKLDDLASKRFSIASRLFGLRIA